MSESIRRLSEAGLVRDTGERTRGRGRTGSYFALAGDLGTALVVSIAPGGVLAEIIDVRGDVSSRAMAQVARQARPAEVSRVLEAVSGRYKPAMLRLGWPCSAPPTGRPADWPPCLPA